MSTISLLSVSTISVYYQSRIIKPHRRGEFLFARQVAVEKYLHKEVKHNDCRTDAVDEAQDSLREMEKEELRLLPGAEKGVRPSTRISCAQT